jgi:hypothetical protein
MPCETPQENCGRKTMTRGLICHRNHPRSVIAHDQVCNTCGEKIPNKRSRDHNRNRCISCRQMQFGTDRVHDKKPGGFQAADLRKEKQEAEPYIPINRCQRCGSHCPKKGKCQCKPLEIPKKENPGRYANWPSCEPETSDDRPVLKVVRPVDMSAA